MDEQSFDSQEEMTWSGDLEQAAGKSKSREPSRTQKLLSRYYQASRSSASDDARSGHRIYRLKGYTTIDKINRKFMQERRQRTLRNLLTFLMVLIFLVILFVIYNPFTDMNELKKITGENSYYNSQHKTETTEETGGNP